MKTAHPLLEPIIFVDTQARLPAQPFPHHECHDAFAREQSSDDHEI